MTPKPDSPPGQEGKDKPQKDSPLDHDQGQGNDPDAPNQDLPKPESPSSPASPSEPEPK